MWHSLTCVFLPVYIMLSEHNQSFDLYTLFDVDWQLYREHTQKDGNLEIRSLLGQMEGVGGRSVRFTSSESKWEPNHQNRTSPHWGTGSANMDRARDASSVQKARWGIQNALNSRIGGAWHFNLT